MSKLRDEIKDAIKSNIDYREGVAYEGEVAWREGWWEWDKAADAILALVREALLSDEVQAPIRHELHHYPRTSTRDTVKTVIDMALDAITGEDDER